MKNILVKSLYKIKSQDWDIKSREEENLYEKYQRCHDISLESFNQRLAGNWEYKFIGGEFDTIHMALRHTYYEIYYMWKDNYPCNILYTDPDTIAIKSVDHIWNCWSKFMMFNYSEPKYFHVNNVYNERFPNFFNAGVRYFPSTMSEQTWAIGLDMAANWDLTDYNTEQIILNKMLWSQGLHISEALVPKIAYQAQWLPGLDIWRQDIWNGCHINDSNIIHLHCSRDLDKKLSWMESLIKS